MMRKTTYVVLYVVLDDIEFGVVPDVIQNAKRHSSPRLPQQSPPVR